MCSTNKLTIIAGDCNLPDIDWSYYSAPNTPIYTAFLDFVNSYGFYQYINEPTRQNNILDIFMATSSTFLNNLTVSPPPPLSTSDHNTVILHTNLLAEDTGSSSSVPVWDFEHTDYAAINDYFSTIDWDDLFSHSISVEGCWKQISVLLNNAFQCFVPVKSIDRKFSRHRRISYPRYIKVMIHRKAVHWKRWKLGLSNSLDDKRSYKEATDNCKRAIHKFHAGNELALIRKNNLGSCKLKSNVSSGRKLSDGTITTNPNEKAKAFNSFFGNVFTQDNRYCPDVTNRVAADRLSSVSFTPNEVRDVLCKLKPTTSAGSDSIPAMMFNSR